MARRKPAHSAPPAELLSRREREIMDAVFALANRASAEDVRGRLINPPSYSAVRAMLVRLEAKGYLRHEEEGVRYMYSATTSPVSARRAAFQQFIRVFHGGSREQLMTTLLMHESWTDEELDTLQAEIERVRKERKR
jgi:BlaI family transcriptional regulator, penicillinase repressor